MKVLREKFGCTRPKGKLRPIWFIVTHENTTAGGEPVAFPMADPVVTESEYAEQLLRSFFFAIIVIEFKQS
jgi:hypothetical protein